MVCDTTTQYTHNSWNEVNRQLKKKISLQSGDRQDKICLKYFLDIWELLYTVHLILITFISHGPNFLYHCVCKCI